MAPTLEIVHRVHFDTSEFPSGAPVSHPDQLDARVPPGTYHVDDSNLPTLKDAKLLTDLENGAWSTVYSATMLQPGVHEPITVAVKLYQEEFFPSRPDVEDRVSPNVLRHTDEVFAWTETWAYRKMQKLQGITIPEFYGAFKFSIGTQREIFGIITKFIEGVNLREYCKKLQYPRQSYDVLRQTANSIHNIQSYGCTDMDVRAENVIVSRTQPPKIAIIDFTSARPINGKHAPYWNDRDAIAFRNMVGDIWKRDESPAEFHQWLFFQDMRNKCAVDPWVKSTAWATVVNDTNKPDGTKEEWTLAGAPDEYDEVNNQNIEKRRNRVIES